MSKKKNLGSEMLQKWRHTIKFETSITQAQAAKLFGGDKEGAFGEQMYGSYERGTKIPVRASTRKHIEEITKGAVPAHLWDDDI